MKIKIFCIEKYALIRLKTRETRSRGIKINAKETVEAMVDAYLLPTIGLNPLVKSLLACVRYFLEVMESLSRSGMIV